MANVTITQLPALSTMTDAAVVPAVAGNVTQKITGAALKTYFTSTTGNITGGNINTAGNVTGAYILGDGSQLTGLPASYGNSNVATYIPTDTYILSITGNVTTLQGQVTSLTGNVYGNANVAAYLPTYTGNITGGNISISGSVLSNSVVSATGNIRGGNINTAGTVTAANISLTGNSSTLTFGDVPVTNRYYVDATRTDTYTQNGSQSRPFKTISGAQAAIATAIAGGLNPEVEPIYIIVLSNITEDVTLATNHVYLIGQNGQIHQPIILSGNVTVQATSGTLNSNHFSISGIEIVGGTNGKAIYVTGTFPTRLSLQDVWITANGTGAGLYQDNTGTGTYTHGGPLKVSHNGSGDVYCFDIRKGTASFETVETSGATQVGAAGPGATLTFNNSQLDANGDVVVETYGNGVVVVTNSVIKNSAANSFGIKLNAVANVAGTVSVGQSAFNVPVGTGSAVWLDPNTTPGLSGVFAWSGASFYPSTNSTISPTLIPGPLAILVGTQVSPIFYGDITSYAVAQDWDLIDNNASALSFDTTGKTGVLELVTTNAAEGVKMSGYASVAGNITGGNVTLSTATGNIIAHDITLGGNISATGNVYGNVFTGNGAGLSNVTATVAYGNAIALGPDAVANTAAGISIGYSAGNTAQQANTIAIGAFAGQVSQVTQAIAIGLQAGQSAQGQRGIAIGRTAASMSQGTWAVAIGYTAGNIQQGGSAIAIGPYAGNTNQGGNGIAMGWNAATYSQGGNSIALGYLSAQCVQGINSIAIGYVAGLDNQGNNSVAIGHAAAEFSQGGQAIAIGQNAGFANQGANSIAIGYAAGYSGLAQNSIVINATGVSLNGSTANALYVAPVRNVTSTNAWTNPANTLPTGFFFTAYNPTTGELIYWS